MAKRYKRAIKGIESLRKGIENHFNKLEKDIMENNFERGRYHFKELDLSFLPALEKKIKIAEKSNVELEAYKKRLALLKSKIKL